MQGFESLYPHFARGAQEAPRRPQEAPRRPPGGPQRAQEAPPGPGGPQRAQEAPRWPSRPSEGQGGPQRAQVPRGPRRPRGGHSPGGPPDGPRRPPEGPSCLMLLLAATAACCCCLLPVAAHCSSSLVSRLVSLPEQEAGSQKVTPHVWGTQWRQATLRGRPTGRPSSAKRRRTAGWVRNCRPIWGSGCQNCETVAESGF